MSPSREMPGDVRHNFIHLMWDIGWYGVLNATALSFMTIYATRIHARPEQIGLINALPALMTMLLALPAGAYLENRSLTKSVILVGILHRICYLGLVLLPFIASEQRQINTLLTLILIMYIPFSAFSLAFNALFGASVPVEWRGYFAGARNALFALVTILVSLLSGYLLKRLPFPLGYQVVFGMGFLGAMLSTYHVGRLRIIPEEDFSAPLEQKAEGHLAWFDRIKLRMRTDVLRGRFLRVLLVLTVFHFTQYLPMPLFPLFSVNVLHLSDQVISVGTAIFYVTMFIGSTQHSRIVSRFGNRWVVGMGMILLAIYPAIISLARGPELYLVANLFGGFAWSLCGTALFNYLLDNVPSESRPAYLAWFSLLANFGILAGSLLGPVVSNVTGIVAALVIFSILRAISGVAILRWG